jgi:hypothetical protein
VASDWFEFVSRVVSRLAHDRAEAFSPEERRVLERAISPQAVYADLLDSINALLRRRSDSTVAAQ